MASKLLQLALERQAQQQQPARPLPPLNAEQRAAATHPADRPLLVVAGAGTGKTTVVIERVAHLISQGVPPARILLLTYSKKMAGEAAERLAARGLPRGVVCSTLHSFCYRVLRTHHREAGYARPPTVAKDAQTLKLLQQAHGCAPRSHGAWQEACGARRGRARPHPLSAGPSA